MQSNIKVELAWKHDAKAILRLAKKIPELKTGETWLNQIELMWCIGNEKGIFLTAKDAGDNLIGFVYGFAETPHTACLMYIAIDKNYRNQGIGETLFNHWHASIIHLGVKKIYTMTTTNEAGDFFKELGFGNHKVLSYWDRPSANISTDVSISSDKERSS